MFVLGTAGHVDHGKSTLIKKLTGIDPDRLKEEKNRQMTIDLGFAWYQLPSGNEIGIIDVPGHRDFIENMLAGIGGIDAVLFVIAADEGIMPQTREHLSILKLLKIKNGLIVLTKIDKVEDDDWMNMVEEDIRELMRGTFLDGASILRVSAFTGSGLDELAYAIDDMLKHSEPKRNIGKPRLPIDRVFTLKGFGTVVTGTLIDGEFNVGQQVELLPGKKEARIRGIQNHKKKMEVALPGNRTAINLSGLEADEVKRGDVVVNPSVFTATRRIDGKIEMLEDASGKIKHDDHLKCFIGAKQALVRVRVIGKKAVTPGDWGWIQMEFDEPTMAVKGDRFVLRRPSPAETIAGGVVLDAHPARRHKRFSESVLSRMSMMESGSVRQILLSNIETAEFINLQEFIEKCGVEQKNAQNEIEKLLGNEIVQIEAQKGRDVILTSSKYWDSLSQNIIGLINDFYKTHPLRFGISKKELIKNLKLDPKMFNIVLQKLISDQKLNEMNNDIGLVEHKIHLSETHEKDSGKIIEAFGENPFFPPSIHEMKEIYGDDLIDALIGFKRLVRISTDIAFLPEIYKQMIDGTVEFLGSEKKITLAQFRDMFKTSRKYALAFLEYLDKEGITVRKDDFRILKAG